MTKRDEGLVELARILDDEATLEALALTADPVPPKPGGRAALLAALEPSARFDAYADRIAALFDLARERVLELLSAIPQALQAPWEDGRVEGVRLLHFDGGPRHAAAHCGLVHIEPGVSYPGHRHRGDEWSLVLAGRAEEDSGSVWLPGDLVHRPAGSAHGFRTLGDEPFVFAVAVHDGIEYLRD